MASTYRVIVAMTFSNEADRDQWKNALESRIQQAIQSGTLPAFIRGHLNTDDYYEPTKTQVDLSSL